PPPTAEITASILFALPPGPPGRSSQIDLHQPPDPHVGESLHEQARANHPQTRRRAIDGCELAMGGRLQDEEVRNGQDTQPGPGDPALSAEGPQLPANEQPVANGGSDFIQRPGQVPARPQV